MFTSNTLHNFPELYYIETFIGEYLINSLFNIHLLSVCHLEHKGRDTNRSILESHGEERSDEVADSWAVFQTEAVIWPQPAFVTLGFMACPPSSFLISLNIFCVLQTQLAPPPSLYLLQWFSVLSPSYLSPSAAHLVLAWPASFSYSILWCAWVWFLVLYFDYIYTHIWKSLSLPVLYCYFYFCLAFSLVAQLCLTLCETMDCSTPGFLVHHQLQELTQTHVHWVRDAIQPSHSLLSPSPLAFNLSQHQGFFFNESVLCIRWPKYWSFSFSISPSNECLELISFRIDWVDLLAVQVTLKSVLQYHSSKASILWCSVFFMVQLSHPYMTTGKNHSFDYMDLCWQSNIYFLICYLGWS